MFLHLHRHTNKKCNIHSSLSLTADRHNTVVCVAFIALASKWKRAPPAEWTVRAGNRLLGTVAAVYWSLSVGVLVAGCSLAYAALS